MHHACRVPTACIGTPPYRSRTLRDLARLTVVKVTVGVARYNELFAGALRHSFCCFACNRHLSLPKMISTRNPYSFPAYEGDDDFIGKRHSQVCRLRLQTRLVVVDRYCLFRYTVGRCYSYDDGRAVSLIIPIYNYVRRFCFTFCCRFDSTNKVE